MKDSERSGLLWMLAGFSTLSVGDAIVKGMAGMWPAPAMAATRYVIAAVVMAGILTAREGPRALIMPRPELQWVRGIAVSASAIGMFMGVGLMPLAEATTITFTQPIITALLAVVILREPARSATWISTAIAFVGVVIVLRPNFDAVGWGVLLPLMAAFGMAVMIIANRAVVGLGSALAMQFYIAAAASCTLTAIALIGHFSGYAPFHIGVPHWSVIARLAFIAFSASLGHWFVYMGTVRAGAAAVAPMTYGQLLTAVAIGWVFFDDHPDAVSLLGAAIIIAAGMYLWWDSRRRAQAIARASRIP